MLLILPTPCSAVFQISNVFTVRIEVEIERLRGNGLSSKNHLESRQWRAEGRTIDALHDYLHHS